MNRIITRLDSYPFLVNYLLQLLVLLKSNNPTPVRMVDVCSFLFNVSTIPEAVSDPVLDTKELVP